MLNNKAARSVVVMCARACLGQVSCRVQFNSHFVSTVQSATIELVVMATPAGVRRLRGYVTMEPARAFAVPYAQTTQLRCTHHTDDDTVIGEELWWAWLINGRPINSNASQYHK